MEEKKEDQVADSIVKEDDQQSANNQEETKKEESMTLEDMTSLVKGLQKGYTVNAQAIAEMKDNLQPIVNQINDQAGNKTGDDEYLTVGKLKQILQEQSQHQSAVQQQSETYIDNTLTQLRAQGVIKTKDEEKELIQYAVDKKEPDLLKAADRWQEVKQAREEGKKTITEKKTQQEEGSKVGTSSKTSTSEQGGVDYRKMKSTDFSDF